MYYINYFFLAKQGLAFYINSAFLKSRKVEFILWLKQIQAMNLKTKEHKQRLIDCFVNAVYLYDDKLVITFNYKEANKTVTLEQVNGSIIECSGAPRNPECVSIRDFFLHIPYICATMRKTKVGG